MTADIKLNISVQNNMIAKDQNPVQLGLPSYNMVYCATDH